MFTVDNKRFLTYSLDFFFQNENSQGTVTDMKSKMLGTEGTAAAAFNGYRSQTLLNDAAFLHLINITNVKCEWPKPVLVRLPHQVSVRYYPPSAWLHRCSDEFGCCIKEYETCQPIREVTVELPFFVSDDLVLNIK